MLDEPTNHLDLGAVSWLEHRLSAFRGGLVLVTHDRHLLDRLTTRMLELDRGAAYVHEGGYASYLEARADRDDQAAAASRRGATWPVGSWPGCVGERRPGRANPRPGSTPPCS